MNNRALLLLLGFSLAVTSRFGLSPCWAERVEEVSSSTPRIYEMLQSKAKTHSWRTILEGDGQLITAFDFGVHPPQKLYELHRGPSGYYETELLDAALSPDASRLAFAQQEDETRHVVSLIIFDVASRATERIVEGGNIRDISWSPNSQQIAYVSKVNRDAKPELFIVDLRTKQSKVVLRGGYYAMTNQSWSPDGRRLVYAQAREKGDSPTIMIYDFASDRSRLLVSNADLATWSPNGDEIAYITLGQDNVAAMHLISPDGQQKATVLQDAGARNDAIASTPLWSPDGAYLLYSRFGLEEPEFKRTYVFELSTGREEALPQELGWAQSFAGKRDLKGRSNGTISGRDQVHR